MRFVESWVQMPLAGAVGWTLLHSLWEGTIIAALLGVTLLALRTARARYVAALAGMLALPCAFGLTLARMLTPGATGLGSFREAFSPAWNFPAATGVAAPSGYSLTAVVPWLAAIWIAGVLILYVRHVAGWVMVSRLRRRGICCAPEPWPQTVNQLSLRLRISRPVQLLESCLVDTPMVLGQLRPLILVPAGLLAGLPVAQVEAILLHELAHIRRHDYLVNILQRFLEGLLFYHPAIWWMSRVVRSERENCCDDVVVAMNGNAPEYAAALAALEQSRWSGREPAVAATGGNLVNRIHRLLYPKDSNSAWTPVFGSLVVLAIVLAALSAWQTKAAPQGPAATAAELSPYRKWLTEDVAYIATEMDRVTFQILKTDEERRKFIAHFWLRRDPTPGTDANEMKEEHYRRIAYANRNFGTEKTGPGWQTDRGRVWILYGPPEEKEFHPNSWRSTPYPTELWKYPHVDGAGTQVFIFVDRDRNGSFRLAQGDDAR